MVQGIKSPSLLHSEHAQLIVLSLWSSVTPFFILKNYWDQRDSVVGRELALHGTAI